MDKAGKKIRAAFNGFRTSQGQSRVESQPSETLAPDDFAITEVACRGFPSQASCMAYDPVQKLIAVGTGTGAIRIFGQPGVDVQLRNNKAASVLQLQFIINAGALLSLCNDNCIYRWCIRTKPPEVAQTFSFLREKITFMFLPFQSTWLFFGTEKGNVHILNVETLSLSNYTINWNKAIDFSQKMHPGSVLHISECPVDANKVLIGFELGTLVLWDLKERSAVSRFQCKHKLRSVSWHYEGKQFLCGLSNGSLMTWSVRKSNEPVKVMFPTSTNVSLPRQDNKTKQHGKETPSTPKDGSGGASGLAAGTGTSITMVEWKTLRNGEDLIVFCGGLSGDNSERLPCLSIIAEHSTTVLEMEYPIVSFIILSDSPYCQDVQDAKAIAVLLQDDLVAIDLQIEGYPTFENPYSMDIHESSVTCCAYFSDCPIDLIRALYAVGAKQKRRGMTENNWPITGGSWGSSPSSDLELMVTGHADGSVKFWDFSAVNLHILYRIRTAKLFDSPDALLRPDLDLFSITNIVLCVQSRYLCVSGFAGHIIVYRFNRHEDSFEIPVLYVSSFVDPCSSPFVSADSPGYTKLTRSSSGESVNSSCSGDNEFLPIRPRGDSQKNSAGYQPELICLTPWPTKDFPETITSIAFNSVYGLLAYSTEQGLYIVDAMQKLIIFSVSTAEFCGNVESSVFLSKVPSSDRSSETMLSMSLSSDRTVDSEAVSKPGVDSSSGGRLSAMLAGKIAASTSSQKPPKLGACDRVKNTENVERMQSSCSSDSSPNLSIDEGVCFITFSEYLCRVESVSRPTVWIGTTAGTLVALNIILPSSPEKRLEQLVTISNSGVSLNSKAGFILTAAFFDVRFNQILPPSKNFRDMESENKVVSTPKDRVLLRLKHISSSEADLDAASSSTPDSATSAKGQSNDIYAVISADRSTKVYLLSTLSPMYNIRYENPFVQANVISVMGKPIVVGCVSNGHIVVYTLPNLRMFLNAPFLPANIRRLQTVRFGQSGLCTYMCSPSEITKFSISAQFSRHLDDFLADLYLTCVMPEPPKQNFLKELLNLKGRSLSRDELFAEPVNSRVTKNAASDHGHKSAFDQLTSNTGGTASEVLKARMAFQERGEKLGEVEERTGMVLETAKTYSEHAHELMMKCKNKKWYQL